MTNDFLPKGYEAPKPDSNYLNPDKGTITFRVLSTAVVGWEYWTNDKKPVRSRSPFKSTPADARLEDGKFKPKHFWAFIVWDYDAKKVKIMEIVQTTIRDAILAYVANPKWGAPQGYDISITGTGDNLNREYAVVAEPHTEAPQADISNIFLEQLFVGGDPFNSTTSDGGAMPNFDVQREVTAEDFPEQTIS